MFLTFYGAAREVTGSCFLLEVNGKKALIDCGLRQGTDVFEGEDDGFVFNAEQIDCVILTHAHIDHSGRLPLLYKKGFRGRILCTAATARLCRIMLLDSAHIQESDAEWKNRKGKRSGEFAIEPLYTTEDAENVSGLFRGYAYGETVEPFEGLKVVFSDAGHLLGSSSATVIAKEGETEKTIVFSGDIGNSDQPLLNDPVYLKKADYVVMESTYADRLHDGSERAEDALASIIQSTLDAGGNLVIPSFAVGRTQEILYFIRNIKKLGKVKGHDGFPVVVDSPLAVDATHIFEEVGEKYYDEEARSLIAEGINPIGFDGLSVAVTTEESREINEDPLPKVVISASGMCEAGRIRHHLKHNLWRKESTVLFVGYQAVGTLGHALVNGAKRVRIFGEDIVVNAKILSLGSTSSHADRVGLMRWLDSFDSRPERVFVVHGGGDNTERWADDVRKQFGYNAVAPLFAESYDLLKNERSKEGYVPEKRSRLTPNTVYKYLLESGGRIGELIKNFSGRTNSETKRFTRELDELFKKYS
ncbi:MAG: MBL fold metallo-hydrolase [Clostridia bacterium]|nr:MBL fold metallo-hydrolase [Clostridia bacterium]